MLDEADRMLDMGFIRDIRKILALLPKQRQNLLFSATFSDEIKQLADGLLHNPGYSKWRAATPRPRLIEQSVHPGAASAKRDLLAHLIKHNDWQQVLVFTRTKHGANRLAEKLNTDGIPAAAIHGNKSQSARTKALADFKDGTLRVLVATDIAARGLDIDQLPHVVNFELPNVPEDYVHRIGRTGRAGNEGEAISLVCVDERNFLRDIERLIKSEIPKVVIDGFAPDPKIKAEPVFKQRQQRPARSGAGARQSRPGAFQPRQKQALSQRKSRRQKSAAADNAALTAPQPAVEQRSRAQQSRPAQRPAQRRSDA